MAESNKPMTAQDVAAAMSVLRPLRPMLRALGELYPAMEVAAGALSAADSVKVQIAELTAEAERRQEELRAIRTEIELTHARHAKVLTEHADEVAASSQQVANGAETARVAIQRARDTAAAAEQDHQRRVIELQNNYAARAELLEREHRTRMETLKAEQSAASKELDEARTRLRALRDDVVRVAEA